MAVGVCGERDQIVDARGQVGNRRLVLVSTSFYVKARLAGARKDQQIARIRANHNVIIDACDSPSELVAFLFDRRLASVVLLQTRTGDPEDTSTAYIVYRRACENLQVLHVKHLNAMSFSKRSSIPDTNHNVQDGGHNEHGQRSIGRQTNAALHHGQRLVLAAFLQRERVHRNVLHVHVPRDELDLRERK